MRDNVLHEDSTDFLKAFRLREVNLRDALHEAAAAAAPASHERSGAAEPAPGAATAAPAAQDWREALEEPAARKAFRDLAEQLLTTFEPHERPVLAVASAHEGEGKTMVALDLAWSLAHDFDEPVLLVDANTHRQEIAHLLGLPAGPGFAESLELGRPLPDALHEVDRLAVMTAGASNGHPRRLTQGRALFQRLRGLFRITIVDAPPVLGVSSGTGATALADGVIWVVRAETSGAATIAGAIDLVGRERVVGVVLNGRRTRIPGWVEALL